MFVKYSKTNKPIFLLIILTIGCLKVGDSQPVNSSLMSDERESSETLMQNLPKMDRHLFLFFKLLKRIETLAYDKNLNEKNLDEFLRLHDEILTLFGDDSEMDGQLFDILMSMLESLIQKNLSQKIAKIKPFRWG